MRRHLILTILLMVQLIQAVAKDMAEEPKGMLPLAGVDTLYATYRSEIEFGKAKISAITIIKKEKEGRIKGTIMNEFGIKLFDFDCNGERCKVSNAITMLDKWYIRRTLSQDMYMIWNLDEDKISKSKPLRIEYNGDTTKVSDNKGRELICLPQKEYILTNKKRELRYRFKQIK